MRWFVPLVAFSVLIQSSILSTWLRPSVIPDLVLVLLVVFAALRGWRVGLVAGLVAAFLESLVSAAPIGVHIFRFGVLGVGAGLIGAGFERTSAFIPPLLVAAATVAAVILTTTGLQAAGWGVSFAMIAPGDLFIQMLLNTAICAAALPLLRRMMARPQAANEVLG